ncbi:MAG: hypothetical protein V7L29_06360 [Nostoc sp.]
MSTTGYDARSRSVSQTRLAIGIALSIQKSLKDLSELASKAVVWFDF